MLHFDSVKIFATTENTFYYNREQVIKIND